MQRQSLHNVSCSMTCVAGRQQCRRNSKKRGRPLKERESFTRERQAWGSEKEKLVREAQKWVLEKEGLAALELRERQKRDLETEQWVSEKEKMAQKWGAERAELISATKTMIFREKQRLVEEKEKWGSEKEKLVIESQKQALRLEKLQQIAQKLGSEKQELVLQKERVQEQQQDKLTKEVESLKRILKETSKSAAAAREEMSRQEFFSQKLTMSWYVCSIKSLYTEF